MALFRRAVRPPATAKDRPDKRIQLPPFLRDAMREVFPFPSDYPDMTGREKFWAALGALVPFIPETAGEQKIVEDKAKKAKEVTQKYVVPPTLAVTLVVSSAIPAKATDAPAALQRSFKWFMTEMPKDASLWVSQHSKEVAAAARSYKQYATAMRLYERVARARDIGFTIAFELPPVRLSDDLGTGNAYDDVVIRPAGQNDLMLQPFNPKNFAINFDFSGLKSQLNGLLMGKWDIDYSRVTIGPDGKKTVQKDPGELATLAKTTAVAAWVLGNQKVNAFPDYVDAGVDTRAKYDAMSKDLGSSWRRRMGLRNRVQERLLRTIQELSAKGADTWALQAELSRLMVSRALDEALTADPSSPTGTHLGEEKLRRLKAMDAQGLAQMELLASNRFRMDMAGQNQEATTDAVGEASKQYNAKNDLSSLVSDVYDLTGQVAEDFGLAWTHQTLPGSVTAQAGAWKQLGKAITDAVKASRPDAANREQIGNQLKQNAYLSGQEQHLAEILRTLSEGGIDQQNDKIQNILMKRQAAMADVTADALEADMEERSQDAIDYYSQGLDKKPLVFGITCKMKGRQLFPEDLDDVKPTGDVPIPEDSSDDLNVAVESDVSDPNGTASKCEDAQAKIAAQFDAKFREDISKVPDMLTKELGKVNWKRLGILDPFIQAIQKTLNTILGKPFNLGDSSTYDKMRSSETVEAGKG